MTEMPETHFPCKDHTVEGILAGRCNGLEMHAVADTALATALQLMEQKEGDSIQRAELLIQLSRKAISLLEKNYGRDPLTQLANVDAIREFEQNNEHYFTINENQRRTHNCVPNHIIALRYDVIGLSEINNQHGHRQGDQCIIAMGSALGDMFRDNRKDSLVGREGGDEFVVYMLMHKEMNDEEIAELIDTRNKAVQVNLQDRYSDPNCGLTEPISFRSSYSVSKPGETILDPDTNTHRLITFSDLRNLSDPKTGTHRKNYNYNADEILEFVKKY